MTAKLIPSVLPILLFVSAASIGVSSPQLVSLETRDARFGIGRDGFIDSLVSRRAGKEYIPAGHPSPLLTLHKGRDSETPRLATYGGASHVVTLSYASGAKALISVVAKPRYLRLKLVSLEPKDAADNLEWGPLHTTISKKIGDIIGVVRDEDWAIGMMGLDDNTIAGPPVDSDCYEMGYYIHSPDPAKFPVPVRYHEGQVFSVGGDGHNDVAFYSHPEEFFQQILGNGATLEPSFGSSISYHARNRRIPYTYLFSLLPGFEYSHPRHQISDPVNVDFSDSSVAIYACPDSEGLATIETIGLGEGLPHPIVNGKWIRDPASFKPDIAWTGPHNRLIEYADALDLKAVQDEAQGEYYADPADHWQGPRVGFSGTQSVTYKDFTTQCAQHGILYGLHTLCLFIQPDKSDVHPVPNQGLQTVLRTKLAYSLTPSGTAVTVSDSSFLDESGTWPEGNTNVARIGHELLTYEGVSSEKPFTLLKVKRGQLGTSANSHEAGEELVKLQMNCYHGFCPDMNLLLDYADYYANVMNENGMQYVDFDGLESTLYQNQGYYGARTFFRRLFDTYSRVSGGKYLRVMGSSVPAGAWDYMSVCNVGGGNNMFDPVKNQWGIEGKDFRQGFANSYFPATFGIQDYRSDWSVFDAENLEAKSVGFDATYMLGLNQEAVEASGEKAVIFKAIRTWENARAAGVFRPSIKHQLCDLGSKFHLEQVGTSNFILFPVRETRATVEAKPGEKAPLAIERTAPCFAIKMLDSAAGFVIALPGGVSVRCRHGIEAGQFIAVDKGRIWIQDRFRRPIFDLRSVQKGKSAPAGVTFESPNPVGFELTVWQTGKGVPLRGRPLEVVH